MSEHVPLDREPAASPARARRATPVIWGPNDAMLALQRKVGNSAVAAAVRSMRRPVVAERVVTPGVGTDRVAAQRVEIKDKPVSETLYNQPASGGQAGAAPYGNATNYDMSRSGDTSVTIKVRIKFLNQSRNTVPPPSPPPPGPAPPALGQLLGTPTEIPASDARRPWAADIASKAAGHWNGQLVLVGEEVNLLSAKPPKGCPSPSSARRCGVSTTQPTTPSSCILPARLAAAPGTRSIPATGT